MLYYPGAVTQFISTALFYFVLLVFILGGGYIWYQSYRISSLSSSLTTCETSLSNSTNERTFVEDNLRILKRSCERKHKPALVKGKLKMENLFNGPDQ